MRGTTCSSNIFFISRGTPGRKYATHSPTRTPKPGAVPTGLGRMSAPSGKSACLELLADRARPNFSRRRRMSSRLTSSRARRTPSAPATASVVMSSVVGPRPPVHTMTRAFAASRSRASMIRSRLSSTVSCSTTSKPRPVSSEPR